MKKVLLPTLLLALAPGLSMPVFAAEEPLCLECHVPAEDWVGMTGAEVLKVAMDPEVKLHEDNLELGEEKVMALIAELVAGGK